MTTIYGYNKCSTCRKAQKWLDGHGITYQLKAIRETPPSQAELKHMLAIYGGDVRKLFNTSGQDYRNLGYKDKLPSLAPEQALADLAANGNLIKRPFVLTNNGGLVGFKEDAWQQLFGV